MSGSDGPVEAKLSTAAAILAAAAALGGTIITYFPLEKFATLPGELVEDSRFFTSFICLFVIIAIAAASYSRYPKSKRLTLYLAIAIFAAGVCGIIGLRVAAAYWVVEARHCRIVEKSRSVLPPQEPKSMADASHTLALKGDFYERARILICDDTFGDDIRADFAEMNSTRQTVLLMLLIGAFTSLFSSLTLLLWSLTALRPARRRNRASTTTSPN